MKLFIYSFVSSEKEPFWWKNIPKAQLWIKESSKWVSYCGPWCRPWWCCLNGWWHVKDKGMGWCFSSSSRSIRGTSSLGSVDLATRRSKNLKYNASWCRGGDLHVHYLKNKSSSCENTKVISIPRCWRILFMW